MAEHPERPLPTENDLKLYLGGTQPIIVTARQEGGGSFDYDSRRPFAKALMIGNHVVPFASDYPYLNLSEYLGVRASIGQNIHKEKEKFIAPSGDKAVKYFLSELKSGKAWLYRLNGSVAGIHELRAIHDPYDTETLEERLNLWTQHNRGGVETLSRITPERYVFTDEDFEYERLKGNEPHNFSLSATNKYLNTNILRTRTGERVLLHLDGQPTALLGYPPFKPEQVSFL